MSRTFIPFRRVHMFTKSLTALALLIPVAAFASGMVPAEEVQTAIRDQLSAQGFVVHEIEAEDRGYEVEADKEGLSWEVTLDADFNIIEMEEDDDGSKDSDG
ncbi:PepSY domain-containing protein [Pseudophaeobacter sp.]|uniref:PepSY domain-containing protein n=1 Tax=Pseudophaeobacter sp. TaxID=1971739 RepID=UPI00329915AE